MTIKKRFKNAAVLLGSLFVLAACGNGAESSSGSSETPTSDNSTESSSSEETLVVYTNSNSDGRGEWVVEKAAEAGFAIEIVGAGGGDVTNRLISEKANPVADVVFGLNHMFYEQLQDEDALIPYEPDWAGEIEEGINDPDGYYNGLVKQALILSFNPEFVDKANAPESYLDLANNEEYAGIYQARDDLGAATSKVIVASILSQFEDPEGELGISDEGWETIDRYFENGVQIPEGEDYFSMFSSGDAPIGTMISGELAAKTEQYGAEPTFIHPEAGTPQVVESIGIVNGTEQEELAQEFVDWFGSAEVQGAFAAEFNAMPANIEAQEQVTDFQKEVFADVVSQDIDWAFVTENIDAWVEKLELEIF
ncbi:MULTISPECIES: extracellular solute-binding protein [Metabacillus]|uniref:ABC transporter substrate-binding protein n=2 Tax=Metabacillus TaxID=2675233 RepID=A0A179T287_9BACI|nr:MULTISPECIES: extracellular solute-binding protein [Metabacillus]OAS88196.1 ABC transporter substrate-binding protein [Metabacillus litoralis]QNF27373.1 extracellular solute-binding protein [Metabacillus sp. KUDC1714]